MEILLDPTSDSLQMNQWAVQTLVWAYRSRFPKAPPLRAHVAANIAYVAICEKVGALHQWQPGEALEFNLAVVHWVIQTGLAVLQDQAAVRGVCRFCGCTGRYACVLSQKGQNVQTCSWFDDSATVCSNPDCVNAVTVGTQEYRRAKPAAVVFPPDPETEHSPLCQCPLHKALEGQVVKP